ncbi:MAG: serine hydrolase domain-containing protein [Ruegeria sp.]
MHRGDRVISAAIDRTGTVLLDEGGPALFPWWSFTKPVIAALVLKASERGLCDLDAPYDDHPFTLRQLMQHRAGLRDYGPLPSYGAAVAAGEDPWPVERLLSETRYRDLAYPPGEGWMYSNVGYLLLRQFLERLHDAPLRDIIETQVCTPLGLSAKLAETRADFDRLLWDAKGYHPGWVYHGCLMGTALDALHLLRALLHGDVLSEASKTQMQALAMDGPTIPGRVWRKTGYGLGLMIGEADPVGRILGHAGCGPFSANLVAHFPDVPGGPFVASFCPGGDETPAEFAAVAVAKRHISQDS